jgi:hypothetical protein
MITLVTTHSLVFGLKVQETQSSEFCQYCTASITLRHKYLGYFLIYVPNVMIIKLQLKSRFHIS